MYGAKKRREEEEEEEEEDEDEEQKGMDFYDFWYGFYMESKDLKVLYGFLGIFMSSKPRV